MTTPRIWISTETPAPGETVRVRAQIPHVMETGLRAQADGTPIPRDTLTRLRVTLNDDLVLEWHPETAVSENPYIEFGFPARVSGTLRLEWTDETGVIATAERAIAVG
ncbi:thiosulfate oxidation carrier complex protein SoxZ [Paracoccus sp. (in: a-proteobacteria)]|uniref:thiosulfate oxidation carrier complex protein SoxZ n=1 Tax=Paracoccus sp. TaxID=267 RepID=UPI0026E09590|nr:thiosulfate oxidation carrier complex protein SoxZ [Paracoccus sp. (in: a-proteobacteria)]MDO5648210.1 thiosulfate oxidation carrier complex protein SoxZ [Paracoccus sp. (in: a-proteobacteria)]